MSARKQAWVRARFEVCRENLPSDWFVDVLKDGLVRTAREEGGEQRVKDTAEQHKIK